MNTRHRTRLAVLAFSLFAAVIAAGVTKAVIEARDTLLEEMAGPEDDPGPQPDREPSRVNWPPDEELIKRTTS